MNTEKFWNRVKAQMKAHKITQVKFAEYIDVPRSTFLRWLKFNISPDVETAYNIATALGVSLEYLVTGENKKAEKIRMEQTEARKSAEIELKKLAGKFQEELLKL